MLPAMALTLRATALTLPAMALMLLVKVLTLCHNKKFPIYQKFPPPIHFRGYVNPQWHCH